MARPGMRYLPALILSLTAALASIAWAAVDGLIGTWQGTLDGEPLVLVLRADGSGTLDGDRIRYQQTGAMLVIEHDGEALAYSVRQDGDRMTVSGGDLEGSVILTRGSAAAPKSRQASAMSPAGGVDASMVGRWCYVSSFSAVAGGGTQTRRCFELSQDGRYAYQSEGSMSAYSPGVWGGTTSNAADGGRWSVSGGSLVAQSDSGAVNRYPLQKRNHPKTGDPMLCLDGDCYVTQYQKPSW